MTLRGNMDRLFWHLCCSQKVCAEAFDLFLVCRLLGEQGTKFKLFRLNLNILIKIYEILIYKTLETYQPQYLRSMLNCQNILAKLNLLIIYA